MRVCIIQPVLKAYREPFFRLLETKLASDGIALTVQYGRPWPSEALRGDNVSLGPPLGRETSNVRLGAGLMLQPAVATWWGADLVVVEHANKHVINYLLAGLKRRAFGRLAYWGHGLNRQGDSRSLAERFKRRSLHWADWWFAYTAGAMRYVAEQGFPVERITTVENSIDTSALRLEMSRVTATDRTRLKREFGWNADDVVGVFCGSLYQDKRLDLLIEASRRVRSSVANFRLLIVGGGPQAAWVAEQASKNQPWIRYEGPRFGADKVARLAMSDICMNPGAVGLGILDAFCAALPMITTEMPSHGPEIEYLEPGTNGLVTKPDADSYATAVSILLQDRERLAALRAGAHDSAVRFSIETMAGNFSAGVRTCLSQ